MSASILQFPIAEARERAFEAAQERVAVVLFQYGVNSSEYAEALAEFDRLAAAREAS